MSRAHNKPPFVADHLLKKVKKALAGDNKKPIKTWSRDSMITEEFVGLNFAVHNGKDFVNVHIIAEMVGHKLGEFAPTRVFKQHSSNNKAEDASKEAEAGDKK